MKAFKDLVLGDLVLFVNLTGGNKFTLRLVKVIERTETCLMIDRSVYSYPISVSNCYVNGLMSYNVMAYSDIPKGIDELYDWIVNEKRADLKTKLRMLERIRLIEEEYERTVNI